MKNAHPKRKLAIKMQTLLEKNQSLQPETSLTQKLG